MLDGINPKLTEIESDIQDPTEGDSFVSWPSPDFSKITDDDVFAVILTNRWEESQKCMSSGSYVSAVVMMGSLLEGALLSVALKKPEKACRTNACPKDQETSKPKKIHDWTLAQLINVAKECGWIEADIQRFSDALRDYRNMVHPWHQKRLGIIPSEDTCAICQQVVRAAINDLAKVE